MEMLLVMLLHDEKLPATRLMVLGVLQPLRSRVSLPPESNNAMTGFLLAAKLYNWAAVPVMLQLKP